MIVGHGLIATVFVNSLFDASPYVVFASGVANSLENKPEAFERELALLDQYLIKSKTIIYFSTTSIFDPTKADSTYIRHKLKIEQIISDQMESYLIVRLPILVGRTSNPFTLMNFLVQAIKEKKEIMLHSKACRHLLDVDDIVPVLTRYSTEERPRHFINIPGSEKISIPGLVTKIQNVLNTKGVFSWKEEGACYDIPSDKGEIIYVERENYIDHMIAKYFGPSK